MKLSLRVLGRPLFESGLIIFSVLFALFVNRCAENQRTEEQREVALKRIAEELRTNKELIGEAIRIHKTALGNLRKAAANKSDSLRRYLADHRYINSQFFAYFVGGKGSFYPRMPSSTSWDAAKSTGIVAEFDYAEVDVLTAAYTTQETFKESTLPYIIRIFADPIADDELETINALAARIEELISQEKTAISYTEEALEIIGERA